MNIKIILTVIIAVTVIVFSACGGSKTDSSSSKLAAAQEASQTEITTVDGGTGCPPERFYYNKLYEYLVSNRFYDGEISKLDRSVLDGYEFIGLTASKTGEGEIPDKNLVSSVYDEGIPVLYNDAKDNFILWFQEDNYWVELVEFPIYE